MVMPVQIIVAVAALAIIAYVVGLLVVLGKLMKKVDRLVTAIEPVIGQVHEISKDVHGIVLKIDRMSDQISHDAVATVGTVRGWTDRANIMVGRVESAVETAVISPAVQISRYVSQARVGVNAFLHAFHWGSHKGDGDRGGYESEGPVADRFRTRRGEGS